ncbi:MAG: polyprenyl synthetase family protein [Ktedonobacteraceae bacterium]|nr:polyprenyl synthetase family protein [Ktedonobacteraceae bacterium]
MTVSQSELMVLSSTIQNTLQRHQHVIDTALHAAFERAQPDGSLTPFYGQIKYHLGQMDAHFAPTKNNPGKLLRPTLLLMAYEASGAWGLVDDAQPHTDYLERALPAAIALELTHNFTLIHDDIEDSDAERRHRPTVWKLWGVPQAINAGDGLFSLARLTLWGILEKGVEGDIAARLGALLDSACLVLSEGQYLDISFEGRLDISVAMYFDMISRKTAALMACATEMGAYLGTRDTEVITRLRSFGEAIGIAFQVRDDLLGVWATTAELGKTQAGDVYRRKKSLPVLHALEQANTYDQRTLHTIYQQEEALTQNQVEDVLAIFACTQTKAYCQQFLRQQCQLAYEALASVPQQSNRISARARHDMETLVHFIEEAAW